HPPEGGGMGVVRHLLEPLQGVLLGEQLLAQGLGVDDVGGVGTAAVDAHQTGASAPDGDRSSAAAGGPSRPSAGAASRPSGATSRTRWLMTVVTPLPCMDTPYRASAISMVRFWWVMTMSWEESRSSSKRVINLPRLVSSRAASTSSMM